MNEPLQVSNHRQNLMYDNAFRLGVYGGTDSWNLIIVNSIIRRRAGFCI